MKKTVKGKSKSAVSVVRKSRIVRDSYTIPSNEHRRLKELQQKCLQHAIHVYKSELIRAGLKALLSLPDARLLEVVKSVSRVKSGRPSTRANGEKKGRGKDDAAD